MEGEGREIKIRRRKRREETERRGKEMSEGEMGNNKKQIIKM